MPDRLQEIIERLEEAPYTFRLMATRERNFCAIALVAVSIDGELIRHAGPKARADPDVVLEAVQSAGLAIRHVAQRWREGKTPETRRVALEAVRQDGNALQYLSNGLRSDYEVVEAAVSQTPWAYRYALGHARLDPDIVNTAVEQNRDVIALVPAGVRQSMNLDEGY